MKFKRLLLIILGFISFSAIAGDPAEEDKLFEKVFLDPVNIELNINLAKAQLTNGHLKAASITLERIIQFYPNEIEPKLLLAEVEFNLGNFFEAKNLFQNVIDSPMSSQEQKNIASNTLQRVIKQQKKWDIYSSTFLTLGQSKNPTNSPRYFTILGENLLNESFSDKSDQFKEIFATLGIKYNLENQTSSNFFTSLNYYLRKYNHHSNVDLNAFTWNIGYETEIFGGKNTITNVMSDINLGDKPYIKTHALNLSHEHLFSNLKSLTNLSFGQNKHQECVDCASSDTRSNTSKSISQTLTFPLTDNWIVESNGTFADYNAKATYETYEMSTLIASTVYSSSFGNVSLSKNVSYSHYEDIDPLANIKRTITVDSKNISFMTAPFQLDKDSQSILNIFRLARPRADDWILKFNFQWGETRSPIKTYQKDIEEISFSIIKNF